MGSSSAMTVPSRETSCSGRWLAACRAMVSARVRPQSDNAACSDMTQSVARVFDDDVRICPWSLIQPPELQRDAPLRPSSASMSAALLLASPVRKTRPVCRLLQRPMRPFAPRTSPTLPSPRPCRPRSASHTVTIVKLARPVGVAAPQCCWNSTCTGPACFHA